MADQRSRRANSGRAQNQRGDVIILRQYLSNDLNRFACADGDLRTNAGFFHQRSRRTRQQCLSALVRFLLYGGLHATPLNKFGRRNKGQDVDSTSGLDRKSVVKGKGGSVRLDLVGTS